MIPNHDPHDTIIVSDLALIRALKSTEHDELCAAQVITDFLSYKACNKSVVMIPRVYRDLAKKVEASGDSELKGYVESFCCEAKIGFSTKNTDDVEYRTVIDYLLYCHKNLIFFLTEDAKCITMAQSFTHTGLVTGNVIKIKDMIFNKDKEFSDKIFREYYDSSA